MTTPEDSASRPPAYDHDPLASKDHGEASAEVKREAVAVVPTGIWMREFVDAVEREAFNMRAPNTHTPVLVGMCIEAKRRLLAASQQAREKGK